MQIESLLTRVINTTGSLLFISLCFGAYVCGRVFCAVDERDREPGPCTHCDKDEDEHSFPDEMACGWCGAE